MRLLRDPRVSLGDKGVALLGLGYVLSPIDLLPGILLGPIGLLDDLFVVAATLSRLLNHVHPDVVRSHWPGKGDALDAIQRVTRWTETLREAPAAGLVRGLLGPGREPEAQLADCRARQPAQALDAVARQAAHAAGQVDRGVLGGRRGERDAAAAQHVGHPQRGAARPLDPGEDLDHVVEARRAVVGDLELAWSRSAGPAR